MESHPQAAVEPVEQELEAESDEERLIQRWRLDQFIRLGFDLVSAALLADSTADLNQVRTLVAHGCPYETATRIVL